MFKFLFKLIKWTVVSVVVLMVGLVGLAYMLPGKSPEERIAIAYERCVNLHGTENCTESGAVTAEYKIILEEKEKIAEQERAVREQLAAQIKAERERQQEAARIAEAAEERRKGFHCLSSWNGSHRAVVKWTKEQLRDPKSFEHDKTLVWPVSSDGKHQLVMQYRAKNGFGGMTMGVVKAEYSNETCSAVIKSIE